MKMPWQRRHAAQNLVAQITPEGWNWALAGKDGRLLRVGSALRDADTPADFLQRLRAQHLPEGAVNVLLPLGALQWLQVDAPGVRPEELKAAARWRIKDQIEGRLDELTIDVMFAGDEAPRLHRQIFVAAVRNTALAETAAEVRAVGLDLSVLEPIETAQRNLHAAMARAEGLGERATAALLRHGTDCLLTVCAAGELFYARRLPWDGLDLPRPAAVAPAPALPSAGELALDSADFIDYGAEPEPGASADGEVPRLVIELQRSFDVWERSWPDLPLAALWVHLGADSPALAALLEQLLGQRVAVLDPARLIPGLGEVPGADALPPALLGALLRPAAGATGAWAQQMNLHSPMTHAPRQRFTVHTMLAALAVLAGGLTLMGLWTTWATTGLRQDLAEVRQVQQREQQVLQQRLAAAPVKFRDVTALDQELAQARQQLQERGQLLLALRAGNGPGDAGRAGLLRTLARTLPDSLWLTEVKTDGVQLEIGGHALHAEALRPWLAHLATQPALAGHTLQAVKVERDNVPGQAERWSFRVLSARSTGAAP